MNELFSQGGKGSTGILTNKQAIARKFGVKQNEVVYFAVGVDLGGYKVIYDKATQRAYSLPVLSAGTTAVSLSEQAVLVHSAGTVDLGELAVTRKEFVCLSNSFDAGLVVNTKNELLFHNGIGYTYLGSLPVTISEGINPVKDANWAPIDINGVGNSEELWRTVLSYVGINLVPGSFERGGTLNNLRDAIWSEKEAKAYVNYNAQLSPVIIPSGSTPNDIPGSEDVSKFTGHGVNIITSPRKMRLSEVIDFGSSNALNTSVDRAQFNGFSKTTNTTVAVGATTVDCALYVDPVWYKLPGGSSGGVYPQKVQIRNTSVMCDAPAIGQAGIFVEQGGFFNFESMDIYDFTNAIWLKDAWVTTIRKVVSNGRLRVESGTSMKVEQCSFGGKSTKFSANNGGIYFTGVSYSHIDNCTSDGGAIVPYKFNGCNAIKLTACGCEETGSSDANEGKALAFESNNLNIIVEGFTNRQLAHATKPVASFISNNKVTFRNCVFSQTGTSLSNRDFYIAENGNVINVIDCQFSNDTFDTPRIKFENGVTTSSVYVTVNGRTSRYYSKGDGKTYRARLYDQEGSDENGRWIKHWNGMKVCTQGIAAASFTGNSSQETVGSTTIYRSTGVPWTFPDGGFNAQPVITAQILSISGAAPALTQVNIDSNGYGNTSAGSLFLSGLKSFASGSGGISSVIRVMVTATGSWTNETDVTPS